MPAPLLLDAPVERVLVLEDRALVTRSARFQAPAGRSLLRLEGVSPFLVDASLQARLLGAPEGARLAVVGVERRRLRPPPAREREERLAELDEHLGQIEEERGFLRRALHLAAREAAQDAARGLDRRARWEATLDALFAAQHELLQREAELRRERRSLLRAAPRPEPPAWKADLELALDLPRPHALALELGYQVPNAAWRPLHRARLDRERGELEWSSEAAVWQATAEDWRGVRLALSTRRSSLGAGPPALAEDLLQSRERGTLWVELREAGSRPLPPAARRRGRPSRAPALVELGGGLVEPEGRFDLPPDGRMHRVPLGSFSSPASLELVALPERSPAALLRCRAEQRGEAPLLPGPVELFLDGGPVGVTRVDYSPPGQPLVLGFGPEPELRAERFHEQEVLSPGLRRRNRRRHRLRILLSNLGQRERELEVVERVPVSELPEVVVRFEQSSGPGHPRPDADGLLRWRLRLPPGGSRTLACTWVLERSPEVEGLD